MLGRRLTASVAVLLLLGTACNSRVLRPPATIYIDGGEQNLTPAVDTPQRSFPGVLLGFFPSKLELYAGDSVRFDMRFNGTPHTVALGTDINKALAAVDKRGSRTDPATNEELMTDIPNVFPSFHQQRAAVQRSAAEPCFIDADEYMTAAMTNATSPCPKKDQPEFDGTQKFYSSGFLPEGEGFRVKLSGDTKPGTYRFMCLVHRAGMQGAIIVKKPGTGRPNVREVKLQGRDEQRVVGASASTVVTDTVKAVNDEIPIAAGAGPEGEVPAYVASFIPDLRTVKVNEPVTWKLFETHSISFRTTREARKGLLIKERDGTVKLNLDAWRAVSSPALPESVQSYPPSKASVNLDGGTYSGEGEWSSGIIRAIPPRVVTYTLRFAKPGTYSYSCLVHHGMRGKIVVS